MRTKAIQFRCFGEGWRRVFGNFSLRGGNQGGGMTSFQALSTAIAAQVTVNQMPMPSSSMIRM